MIHNPRVRVLGIRGTRIRVDRTMPVPSEAWYSVPGQPVFQKVSRGVQCQHIDVPLREGSARYRLNFNHPVHVLLVGGLDPRSVVSMTLEFNNFHEVKLVDRDRERHQLCERLKGADDAVVDVGIDMQRGGGEVIDGVMVFRLSDAPLDAPDKLINFSRVSCVILNIKTDVLEPVNVRVAVIHHNVLRTAGGMAGLAFAS